jgi:hypothetical protein
MAWGWIGQYLLVVVIALLLGPLLSNLGPVRRASVDVMGLSASQIARLAADGIALLTVWMMAYRTSRRLSQETGGAEFLRAVLPPIAMFGSVFFTTKMSAAHGSLPLDQIEPSSLSLAVRRHARLRRRLADRRLDSPLWCAQSLLRRWQTDDPNGR